MKGHGYFRSVTKSRVAWAVMRTNRRYESAKERSQMTTSTVRDRNFFGQSAVRVRGLNGDSISNATSKRNLG